MFSTVAIAKHGGSHGGGNTTTYPSGIVIDNVADSFCPSDDENTWVTTNENDLWHLVVSSGVTTVSIEELSSGTATVNFENGSLSADYVVDGTKWSRDDKDGVAWHIYLSTLPRLVGSTDLPTSFTLTWDDKEETRTIGEVRWSHSCLLRDQSSVPDPTVTIEEITGSYTEGYDNQYSWTIAKSVASVNESLFPDGSTYTLDFTVTAERSGPTEVNSHVVDGSVALFVTVSVTDAELADVSVTVDGGLCSLPDAATVFECTGLDVAESYEVTAAVGVASNEDSIDFDALVQRVGRTLRDELDKTVTIADSILEEELVAATGTEIFTYSTDWTPTACGSEFNNTATLYGDDKVADLGSASSATVAYCPQALTGSSSAGRTIGYWGNKWGAPQVVDAYVSLKLAYPELTYVPITTAASVRDYFTKANCKGDCVTMFRAQALATAMNARFGDFGAATVAHGGVCRTVDSWLTRALNTHVPTTTAVRQAYAKFFDGLNNNLAQPACATVGG